MKNIQELKDLEKNQSLPIQFTHPFRRKIFPTLYTGFIIVFFLIGGIGVLGDMLQGNLPDGLEPSIASFISAGFFLLFAVAMGLAATYQYFVWRIWQVHFTENEIVLRHFFHSTRYSVETIKMMSIEFAPKVKGKKRSSDLSDQWYLNILLKGDKTLRFAADKGLPSFGGGSGLSTYIRLPEHQLVEPTEEKIYFDNLLQILKSNYLPHQPD